MSRASSASFSRPTTSSHRFPRTLKGASSPGCARPLRVLDITKFYGEESGGVRTYLDAKIRDFSDREKSHALVIPGATSSLTRLGNSRIHRVPGPVIPFAPTYRLLLSLPMR